MLRSYHILFSIKLFHEFYEDGISKDFVLTPSPECQRVLDKFGMIFQPEGSGGHIYYEEINGRILRKLEKKTSFVFLLKLQNPNFFNFSDLGNCPQKRGRTYYFTNIDRTSGTIDFDLDPNMKMYLSEGVYPKEEDLYLLLQEVCCIPFDSTQFDNLIVWRTDPKEPRKTIQIPMEKTANSVVLDFQKVKKGRYELEYTKQGNAGTVIRKVYIGEKQMHWHAPFALIEIIKDQYTDYNHPIRYSLEFERLRKKWKYLILRPQTIHPVSDLTVEFEVEQGETYPEVYQLYNKQFDPVAPTQEEQAWVNTLDQKEVQVFQSSEALPMYERPLPFIHLKENGKTKLKHLPNPSVREVRPAIFINL